MTDSTRVNGLTIEHFTPPTFDATPTWVNRTGRVDRSACAELRASEVRRRASMRARRSFARPTLEAVGECTITARELAQLHGRRPPQSLEGDFRTPKSNAMRRAAALSGAPLHPVSINHLSDDTSTHGIAPSTPTTRRRRRHRDAMLVWPTGTFRPVASNPNRGVRRTKLLGLTVDWSQRLRIECHRLHDRLAQHFLICPNAPSTDGSSTSAPPDACLGRAVKLFLPLCTEEEGFDAHSARLWIDDLDQRFHAMRIPMPAGLMQHRAALIARYSMLFQPRMLLCRGCLGLRYGEAKIRPS